MDAMQIKRLLAKELKKRGSDGKFYVFDKIEGTSNSYDSMGNEISLTDVDNVSIIEVVYSSKKTTVEERTRLSLNDNSYRLSFDYLEDHDRIRKGNTFSDSQGLEFSVEHIDIIGDQKGIRMLSQVFIQQD